MPSLMWPPPHDAQSGAIVMLQDVVAAAYVMDEEATRLQRPEQTARRNRGQFGHPVTATVIRRTGGSSGASYGGGSPSIASDSR